MPYKRISGIYTITCVKSGKVYVGRSVNIKSRFEAHRRQLRNGNHLNRELQEDYNKFGVFAFSFEIIHEVGEDCDFFELDSLEKFYIEKFDAFTCGYNETRGGTGNLGKVFSSETRRKMSESNKGVPRSFNTRRRISDAKKKKVIVRGKEYASILDASDDLGINYGTLRSRLKNPNYPDHYFLDSVNA